VHRNTVIVARTGLMRNGRVSRSRDGVLDNVKRVCESDRGRTTSGRSISDDGRTGVVLHLAAEGS
jgi:hypothetical protein